MCSYTDQRYYLKSTTRRCAVLLRSCGIKGLPINPELEAGLVGYELDADR